MDLASSTVADPVLARAPSTYVLDTHGSGVAAAGPTGTPPPRTIVHTEVRYRTLVQMRTRVITRTKNPQIPGSFMPSTHPAVEFKSFETAGGNIHCTLAPGAAACTVAQHSWTVPSKKVLTCANPEGQGIYLENGPSAVWICDMRARYRNVPVIHDDYDDSYDGITCQVRLETARSLAVNCFNDSTGRGFMLGRGGYFVY